MSVTHSTVQELLFRIQMQVILGNYVVTCAYYFSWLSFIRTADSGGLGVYTRCRCLADTFWCTNGKLITVRFAGENVVDCLVPNYNQYAAKYVDLLRLNLHVGPNLMNTYCFTEPTQYYINMYTSNMQLSVINKSWRLHACRTVLQYHSPDDHQKHYCFAIQHLKGTYIKYCLDILLIVYFRKKYGKLY